MKKTNLIILKENKIYKKWEYERFFLKNLSKKFNIELISFYKKKNFKKIYKSLNSLDISNTIIINDLPPEDKYYYNFYQYLKKKNFITGCFDYNLFNISFFLKVKKNLLYTLIKFNISRIINFLKKIFKFKKNHFIPNFYISCNVKVPKSFLIKSHNFDYYNYKKNLKITKITKKTYSVFLDDAPSHHSDYSFLKVSPDANFKIYKKEINSFLQTAEILLGHKIIISGHPRERKKNIAKKIFTNNKIVYNKTSSLVKNAKIVFCHNSLAVNFAVLFKKPLIFLNSSNFKKLYQLKIHALKNFLNCVEIDIDKKKIYSNLELVPVDHYRYNLYKNKYIKCRGLKSNRPWCDFIKNYKKLLLRI